MNIIAREFSTILLRGRGAVSIIVLVSFGAGGFTRSKLDKSKVPNIISYRTSLVKKNSFIGYFLYKCLFVI